MKESLEKFDFRSGEGIYFDIFETLHNL